MTEAQEQPDLSLLLRSKKEHFEKETERLLAYFDEQLKAADPYAVIGKRFRQKEQRYSSLLKENKDLMLETRNLNQQIQRLRMSLRDSGKWEEGRISMDRAQRVESMLASKQEETHSSYDEQLRNRIDSILGQKLEEAREEYSEYGKDLDSLIESVISYLTRDKTVQQLTTQMAQNNSQGDTVTVPKKRYQKLIEICSINLAEHSINQLRNNQYLAAKEEDKALNYLKQASSTFQQRYSDIVKGENVDTRDLYQLFRALAKKVGFEQEWERYHKENAEAAVALKAQVDSIVTSQLLREVQNQSQASELIRNRIRSKDLLTKIDKLVNVLPFDSGQKKEWKSLSSRITQDRLINMQSVVQRYQDVVREDSKALLTKIATFSKSTLSQAIQELTKVVHSRLNMKEPNFNRDLEQINLEALVQTAMEKISAGEQLWSAMETSFFEKAKVVFRRVGKSFVFCSGTTLFRTAANKK